MKTIEVEDDLYLYIASQTQHIGESASDILRRLLDVNRADSTQAPAFAKPEIAAQPEVTESANIVVPSTESELPAESVSVPAVDGVKALRSLLISDEFAASKKAIDRFMLVLCSLYNINKESFAEATQVKGRTRVYFADNEKLLLASGNTTKPKAIPGTPFWVITNTNTNRKRQMVEQLMAKMGFQSELIDKVCGSI